MSKFREVSMDTESIRRILKDGGHVYRQVRNRPDITQVELTKHSIAFLKNGLWTVQFDGYNVILPATEPEPIETPTRKALKAPTNPFNPIPL